MLVDFILSNRWLAPALACIVAAIAIWFKGYSSGKKTVEADNALAKEELSKEVHETEAKNQEVNTQREKDVEGINATDTVNSLIKLWNDFDKKAPGNSSDKDN